MALESVIVWLLWLIAFLLVTAALIFLVLLALWLLVGLAWLLANQLPAELRWKVLRRVFRLQWMPEKAPVEENSSAERNHRSIGDWVAQSIGFDSVDDLPAAFINRFSLRLHGQAPADPWAEKPPIEGFSSLAYRILTLSKTIRDDTAIYWDRRRQGYRNVQASTWITIGIGLITTVLVSLRSTDFGTGSTGAARLVQILAIVFPAVGTAAAAIIGFYGFSDRMGRASHTLNSLRQLHGHMAVEIWSLDPAGAKAADADFVKTFGDLLKDWEKRYVDIKDVAEAEAPGGNRDASSNTAPAQQGTTANPAGTPPG
jgi:hypothetical protein